MALLRPQTYNIACFCANLQALLLSRLKVFFLPNVCNEADDLETLFNEPLEDTRGVQATAVGQTYPLVLRHGVRVVCAGVGESVSSGEQRWGQACTHQFKYLRVCYQNRVSPELDV